MHSALNLPTDSDEALLRASFVDSDEARALLVAALAAPAPRSRVLALRGLVRHDVVTDDQWRGALGDPDVTVRREALTQVSQVTASDDVKDLVVALLNDEDALVVEGAAFAIGEFVYLGGLSPLLEIAAQHDDARCREAAIAALGALGDDAARAVIIGALDDKPPVRRRAIVALAAFEGPDIEAALERASDDRDWQVRAAVSQLGRDED